MRIDPKIPVPFTFNPHKHHFGFLLKQVEQWKTMKWEKVEDELSFIGSNLLDLYLGDLSVEQICEEGFDNLNQKNITNVIELKNWLKPAGYKKIELSDGSMWVIKEGISQVRFIHIHPAKDSQNAIRVRGTTLKTILALKTKEDNLSDKLRSNLKKVNKVREKYLGISPIKSLERGKGISRLWDYFNSP